MKRAIVVAVAVAVAGFGIWKYAAGASKKRGNGAGRVVEVVTGPIEQSIDATGSVAPRNRVEIKPPVSGRIEKLLVDEGDHVKQSQLVAWISSTDRNAILDAARAQGPDQLKKWEDAYKPTAVFASLPGEVILKNVVVGQAVDGGTVLYAVADTLIVTASVDESDIGKIRLGQPARIRLDSYPDRPVEGKVFDILYEGKNISNVITYGVKIRAAKLPPFFRSQMTANVSFLIKRKEEALIVPAAAVKDAPGGKRVVTIPGAEKGTTETKEVTVGIETDDKVEIVDGLAAGDKVLVAQGKYVAQKAPESSPLSSLPGRGMGGRGGATQGAAPRPKKPAAAAAAAK